MTEQYEPSDYDLYVQDPRLDSLESLISAEYEPPEGAQYSYPIANQGITQDQWQQMNLTAGDGVIITEDSEYSFRLVKHDTDSETNQRNTLILKVSDNTGRNEASMAGFYFRQTEDIELPFPAVTSTTTYYVTVTYDPRKFKTTPLRIEVFANDLPRQQGQQHIVLRTVRRSANQLLSQAPISTLRHYVSPVITAVTKSGLPESTDVLYGTLGIVRPGTSGGKVIAGTGEILEARGIHGWHNVLKGEWQNLSAINGYESTWLAARRRMGGIDIVGRINTSNATRKYRAFELPAGMGVNLPFRAPVFSTSYDRSAAIEITPDVGGRSAYILPSSGPIGGWVDVNVFVPDYYL